MEAPQRPTLREADLENVQVFDALSVIKRTPDSVILAYRSTPARYIEKNESISYIDLESTLSLYKDLISDCFQL